MIRNCVLFLLSGCFAQAVTINWRSVQSPNPDLTVAVRVELGNFGSFRPTPDNVSEWLENWTRADGTDYNAGDGFFASSFDYQGGLTGQAFMWLADYRGNWILLTNPTWTWPDASSPIALPEDFFTSDPGTTAIVGVVSTEGRLTPESIRAPAPSVIFEGWLEERNVLAEGDTDGDGRSNFEEFIYQSDPNSSDPLNPLRIEVADTVRLIFPAPIHPQIRMSLIEFPSETAVAFEQIDGVTLQVPREDKAIFSLRFSLK